MQPAIFKILTNQELMVSLNKKKIKTPTANFRKTLSFSSQRFLILNLF